MYYDFPGGVRSTQGLSFVPFPLTAAFAILHLRDETGIEHGRVIARIRERHSRFSEGAGANFTGWS